MIDDSNYALGIRLTLSLSLTLTHKAVPTQPTASRPAPRKTPAHTRAKMETRQPPRTACLRARLLAHNFDMSVRGAGFDGIWSISVLIYRFDLDNVFLCLSDPD